LLFSLPSGFGLKNRVSSLVRQREKKARIRVFFAVCPFAFSRSRALLFRARERKSAKKERGRPPLLAKQCGTLISIIRRFLIVFLIYKNVRKGT
jgi:hypothetical protein